MTNSRPTEGVRMTARMPDKLSRNVSRLRAEAASSLTTTAINRPIANVTAATPRKLPRQPIVAVEKGERSRRQECSQRSDPDLQAGVSRDNLDENGGGNQGLKRRPVAKS